MKTFLVLFIICFVALTVKGATEYLPLNNLHEGDWFDVECSLSISSSTPGTTTRPDEWGADNVMKTTFRGKVLKTSGHKVQIAFDLIHLYYNLHLPACPQFPYKTLHYYDSYFSEDTLKPDVPVLTCELSLKEKKETTATYQLSDSTYIFEYEIIPSGLKKPAKATQAYSSQVLPLSQIATDILLPWLKQEYKSDGFSSCHLIEASFPLTPNYKIRFRPLAPLAEKDAVLYINNRTYPLTQEKDGSYGISFRLNTPQIGMLAYQLALPLIPGDTLEIMETPQGQYHFKGQGATDCYVSNILQTSDPVNHYYDYELFFSPIPGQTLEGKITNGKKAYEDVLRTYGANMHPYWKKKHILDLMYWEMSIRFRANLMANLKNRPDADKFTIFWEKAPFNEVLPFTDYHYLPSNYTNFLDNYAQFKAQQMNEDNLTNKFYWESDANSYYLKKQMFSGYPQAYLLAENLKYRIKKHHLSKLQRDYDDFMALCREPENRQEVEELWKLYQKIEPGANIRNSGMQIVSYLPLKKKADGYIILTESFIFGDPQDFETNPEIERILQSCNLQNKTQLCYFRPESRRKYLPDSLKGKNPYIFIPDQVIDTDKQKFDISPWAIILMKNDGTIISREVSKTRESIDGLKQVLQKELQSGKKEKSFSKSEVLGFLAVLLALVSIGGIVAYVRFRRIKLSRKLTELELKAIRSQMNPHFVFNAMGSIQALILQNKNQEANQYLTDFSRLLRKVLTSSEKQLIPLSDEIQLIRLYLKLEQLRTPFEYSISVAPSINPDTEEIPGMLLQPLVENAVLHGIVPQGNGHIDIRFYQENHILYSEITDDGKGPENIRSEHTSKRFGLRAIQERLKLLNQEYHAQIGLKLINRREEGSQGCRVVISIPV